MKKSLLLKSTLALALASPLLASAESTLTTGTGTATARLDFRVIVSRVLFLGVGTGAATVPLATNNTVDTVTLTIPAGGVGNGTPVVSGNVPVRVVGNDGQISLSASTTGLLTNAGGDTILWSTITPASDVAALPNPAFPTTGTGAGASSNVTISGGRVTDRSANWTFSYANATVVPPGTYGVTNGRVTYTASMP